MPHATSQPDVSQQYGILMAVPGIEGGMISTSTKGEGGKYIGNMFYGIYVYLST